MILSIEKQVEVDNKENSFGKQSRPVKGYQSLCLCLFYEEAYIFFFRLLDNFSSYHLFDTILFYLEM